MKKIVLLVALALFISLPTQSLAAMKFSDVNNRTQNAILEKLFTEKIEVVQVLLPLHQIKV